MPISLNPRTFEPETISSAERPTLDLSLPPRELENEAWRALRGANSPPDLFVDSQTREPVRLVHTDDGRFMHRLSRDALRRELVQRIRWEKGAGGRTAWPPERLVQNMLSRRDAPLPVLRRVAHFPFYSASGEIVFQKGYDESTRIYLSDDFTAVRNLALDLARLPAERRIAAILEPFRDFPFEDYASSAHLVALMVTALVREMIPGTVPLFCVNKPCPGLGGTLLVQTVGTIITGRPLPVIPPPDRRDGAELRRLLTSALRDQPVMILLDNWDHLQSPSLASMLTSQSYSDRQISTSEMFLAETSSIIVAVGNNVELGPEIGRRTVPIHLRFPDQDPLRRTDYRIADLLDWTRRHRGRLLGVLIGMVEAWKQAGSPKSSKRLPSFEAWSAIIGGIIEANGVGAVLGNLDLSSARSDPRWLEFFQAWDKQFGARPVPASDLLQFARNAGVAGERETAVALGRKLSSRAGGVFDGFSIQRVGRIDNAALYKLQWVGGEKRSCTHADESAPGAVKFLH